MKGDAPHGITVPDGAGAVLVVTPPLRNPLQFIAERRTDPVTSAGPLPLVAVPTVHAARTAATDPLFLSRTDCRECV